MPNLLLPLVLKATWQTIDMVFIGGVFSSLLGLVLGVILFLSARTQDWRRSLVYHPLNFLVNVTRSVPFIILMIAILPFTRWIIGTSIGTSAAIVPLTLAALPFFARIAQSAFEALPESLHETARALGANPWQFVVKFLIPESLPALFRGLSLTLIGLIGYSAMAGTVGGGGLGELAINYGYQRFNGLVMLETVIILVILVQLVQAAGDHLARRPRLRPVLIATVILAIFCFIPSFWPAASAPSAVLRVGVMSGQSEEVMAVAQKVAWRKYHLKLEIVTFDDYVLPNTALENGSIDANIFQHVPYLDDQIAARHLHLTPLAKTFVYPMGFYSRKIHSLSQLQAGDIVAIPNDPSNEARSLLLLAKAQLIQLKRGVTLTADVTDIVNNPLHLQFKTLDAAQLPRALQDASLVALTNDYVAPAGFTIAQSILKEGSDSLYANVIVVRTADLHNPLLKDLVAVMHSHAVVKETLKLYPGGAAIPAW